MDRLAVLANAADVGLRGLSPTYGMAVIGSRFFCCLAWVLLGFAALSPTYNERSVYRGRIVAP
jgi:hypothetical protein